MKESYSKGLAICAVPEWYAGGGDIAGLATTGAHAGQVLSSEITHSVCRRSAAIGRQNRVLRFGEKHSDTAESETLCMCGNSRRENREILLVSVHLLRQDCNAWWNGTVRQRLRRYS